MGHRDRRHGSQANQPESIRRISLAALGCGCPESDAPHRAYRSSYGDDRHNRAIQIGDSAKAPLVALTKPQPIGQDCGLKFSPESAGDANRLDGLACLLLTQDGQGMTLPDGAKLFRRWGVIEEWKGDAIIQSSPGLVVRDAQQRYWFLEFRGWL